MSSDHRILVLGATGMLGNAAVRVFDEEYDVWGSARSGTLVKHLPKHLQERIVIGVDVEQPDALTALLDRVRPHVVVNCVGIVKQLDSADDPLTALPLNSLLPHRLARLCALSGARLVHVSTDCVFSGRKGAYLESDFPDANDLYGRSKYLGEVDYPNAVTLRTSIIGHELAGARSLLCWFLNQQGTVKGYTRAIFSGLPTNELARVIRDFVLPKPELRGLYHVAAAPIDKYSLLRLVADVYGKQIEIVRDDALVIDRSLNAARFQQVAGYEAPEWRELVQNMHEFNRS